MVHGQAYCLSQSESPGLLTFFSCLSSYSVMLNIISTPFLVTLFYFYLNKATWVNFSSLLQISNSNILFISSFIRHFGFILYAAIIVCTCQ